MGHLVVTLVICPRGDPGEACPHGERSLLSPIAGQVGEGGRWGGGDVKGMGVWGGALQSEESSVSSGRRPAPCPSLRTRPGCPRFIPLQGWRGMPLGGGESFT